MNKYIVMNTGDIKPFEQMPDHVDAGTGWLAFESISEEGALNQAYQVSKGEHKEQYKIQKIHKQARKKNTKKEAKDFLENNLFLKAPDHRSVTLKIHARDYTSWHGIEPYCKDQYGNNLFKKRYWAAEITGLHSKYRFNRTFMKGRVDFTHANKRANRGVYIFYLLEHGKIYQVSEPVSNKHTDKYFCTVLDGSVVRLEEKEVVEWLKKN